MPAIGAPCKAYAVLRPPDCLVIVKFRHRTRHKILLQSHAGELWVLRSRQEPCVRAPLAEGMTARSQGAPGRGPAAA